ncbi:MAG: glycine cleavage system protein H [Omnitrophica bacterium RIFCSPLOWO2_12_FULL_44_17]|uniref:Glycine cleavage system H protein n=1 Tax=Candidatus Danuiimicrobium aquiferis TaxID=1801832 RepID=A0A1G1KS42_9BACT|nr:MAG: glycine cleavage system protein H [Omnitrophica bacterium RIFCSPHIGHO2_02_FULL_45_28]OGW91231.1 MAG: glycine cleavage system protein H [Omnitrophica bacterium RIFCSPHIGHO2_12_FULL_44_12]OGW95632.1 MAG: glycine cleavage system protein H [Omnitrophica bacterium RIFCSPLOWO2_12_FULL_44_17]OGX03655.1 MAG: glycine cleavage system protein H [Omnitrophica bacterium RIFCSPLOWO2_02_FULL_44_11]
MNYPNELRYTKTHEWVRRDGNVIKVGITEYAQHEITDVVYVELPHVGNSIESGKPVCIVESVKAAFDIYAPMSGVIKAINTALESDPGLINRDPYGSAWLFELSPSNVEEWDSLMTSAQYEQVIKQGV